jgi:1-aminocyclopropane-1-carboxylate deaminase/D-cysteine desulfhydrase-like pyridoxal-dependent ACC family enzyme
MRYIVESISTFHEMHVVEADSKEDAKLVAENADWNSSVHVGVQVLGVYAANEHDKARMKAKDDYFFEGYSHINKEGVLAYHHENGLVNDNMPIQKVL